VTSTLIDSNGQDFEAFEDLIAEFGDQVDKTLTAADTSKVSDQFMEYESPAVRKSLASEPVRHQKLFGFGTNRQTNNQ
jgi:hypothetical protein